MSTRRHRCRQKCWSHVQGPATNTILGKSTDPFEPLLGGKCYLEGRLGSDGLYHPKPPCTPCSRPSSSHTAPVTHLHPPSCRSQGQSRPGLVIAGGWGEHTRPLVASATPFSKLTPPLNVHSACLQKDPSNHSSLASRF